MRPVHHRCPFTCILTFLVCLLSPVVLLAHADIQVRLAELTQQIASTPNDPALYLQRAELHRRHQDWEATLADYRQVERLAPSRSEELEFYRGQMWLEAGQPGKARALLDRYLAMHPDHVQALVVRGHAAVELGEPVMAARFLSAAIQHSEQPTPELYLERAQVLVSAGPKYVDQALRGIDEGLIRLGPVIKLIQYAIDLEQERGHYTAALARFETLPPQMRGHPKWITRRGEILAAAGRVKEARTTYAKALSAIQELPPRRQRVKAVVNLEAEIRQRLGRTADSQ